LEKFLESGRANLRCFAKFARLTSSKTGFIDRGSQIPHHLSLLNILKRNGYSTAFYYGGDSKFDNMKAFLTANKIDAINDEQTFPAGYIKMPASDAGFSWGYGDAELFRRYLQLNPSANKPRLDVLLTVSTHNPFLFNEQKEYLAVFERRMKELNFNDSKKNSYRHFRTKYASILYADNSLKKFISEYAKRADYHNTIFMITGDHRMPELPMSSKIDRYHVPLIIYSPLLKRTAEFASISSHFDIAPSLLAFLNKSYNLRKPTIASWLGDGLDTTRSFRNVHNYPLMQAKTVVTDYVMDTYHLNNETLFTLSSDMDENSVAEKSKLVYLKAQFKKYKKRNEKFAAGAPLIPDSLFRKYAP
jgi:phosphoglycerol transferase MdoB-like AlkP superfamily enzyme